MDKRYLGPRATDHAIPWPARMQILLRSLCIEPLEVESFLFDEDHPYVQHLLADRTPYETPKVDEKAGDKWVDKHFDMFSFEGFKWPPVFTKEVKAAVQHLPPRQQEIVSFFLSVWAKEKEKDDMPGEWIIDLQPNIDYGSRLTRRCPCIVSMSRLFCLRRLRELTGFLKIP